MSISVTSKSFSVFGDKAAVVADLAFSGNYAYGGESIDNDQLFGIHDVELALVEPKGGYSFVHDKANKKIKVFTKAPPIVYEEKQTPSSDIVTTKYPAAFIMNVARTGNNKKLRSTGIARASLADDECCLVSQMAAGERTQIRIQDYDRLTGDGGFAAGATTNWTLDLAYWTTASNKLNKDADSGTAGTLVHTFTPTVGRTYRVTFVISSWSVGSITMTLGGVSGAAAGADGTYTQEVTAITTGALSFLATDTSRFTIDSITVYDITEPIYITYVTQAWKDVWDNLVQDEEITLATGDNTLGEVMPNLVDRDFSGASAWTNVDIDSYDETTSAVLTITANAAGQYCYLPLASAPTVPGTAYKLTIDAASLTGSWLVYDLNGVQLIGTIQATGTPLVFEFTAETYGGLRLVAGTDTASVVIDNVSISHGNKILACMYVDQTEATAVGLTMIDDDDTAATNEVAIKFNSTRYQLQAAAAQDGKDCLITYVKVPASGFLADRAFNDETAIKAGVSGAYVNTFTKPILLWGYTGQMPVYGGTTQRIIDSAATPGAGECIIDWTGKPRITPSPPPLIVEELITVTSNVGKLDYLPLYIVAVEALATATPVVCNVIPTGQTVATKQVSVNFTTGDMTFYATDAITTARITYIPKRKSGCLSSVTVDESHATLANATPKVLAARAGLVQYVWDDTDNVLMQFEQANVEPTATHFVQVDINDSATTTIDNHSDDDGNTILVTYVPFSQIPKGCQIDDTGITLSSEAWNFTGNPGNAGYNNLVVPAFGTMWAGEEAGTASHYGSWTGPSGVDGAAIAAWYPATNSLITDDATAITELTIPWMILDANQLTPFISSYGQIVDVYSNVIGTAAGVWGRVDEIETIPLEIKDGESLSALASVKIIMIGT